MWRCFTGYGTDSGARSCRLAYEQLQSLPIHWVDQTEALLLGASQMKAFHWVYVVDAWIAAATLLIRATSPHQDSESEAIIELDQSWLA